MINVRRTHGTLSPDWQAKLESVAKISMAAGASIRRDMR